MILTRAAINEGFDSTHIPSYGPESRGGTSYADVHVARTEVLSPAAPQPHVLVAFNAPSLAKFGPTVRARRAWSSTTALSSASRPRRLAAGVTTVAGALLQRRQGPRLGAGEERRRSRRPAGGDEGLPRGHLPHGASHGALKDKCAMIPVNEEAFKLGAKLASEHRG